MRLALLTAAALATSVGCAHRGPATPPPLPDPGPRAVHWQLPARILDGRTGAELTPKDLLTRLLAHRVVYVAESHDDPHHHAVQAQLLHDLHAAEPSLGIGLEMVKRPFQKWLTDYAQGRITEAEMLERTEWATRWGFDFTLYRPILEQARAHRLPLYALNIRDEITRQVARQGLDSLSAEDRAAVPELDLSNEAHRAEIKAILGAHGDGGHGGMRFDDFYTAQVMWDETMAQEVARELHREGAPARILVLAGGGHIRKGHGIPSRAARRGATPYITVYPVVLDDEIDLDAMVAEGVADILWVMTPPSR